MKALLAYTVLSLMVVANAAGEKRAVTSTAEGIHSYCRNVAAFATQLEGAKLIFAEVCPSRSCGGAAQTTWRKLADASALEEVRTSGGGDSTAFVWFEDDKLVEANFTFQSGSGDWVNYANYCFRPDGSLALLKSTLNTFYGEMSVERETLFSADGTTLDSSTRYLELRTRKPKRHAAGFIDEKAPVYRSVFDLPFLVISPGGRALDGPEMSNYLVNSSSAVSIPIISPERQRIYPPLEALPPKHGEQ